MDELAITDHNIITAIGLGSIEFGRENIKRLDIFSETDIQEWFDMYKYGVIPAKYKTT